MSSTVSTPISAAPDLHTPNLYDLPRTRTGKALLALGATAFVAMCAHVSVPLYFTPVPFTLQTLAVLLIGLVFGPVLGASTLLLYLAEGAAGLPVFSPHGLGGIAQLLGPTGGYLFSYPLAAAAAGTVARRARGRLADLPTALLAGFAASFFVFSIGAGWAAHLLHLSPAAAWRIAVLPFLPGETIKIATVAAMYTTLLRWRRS